jgi:DNA-directed RNA polymerase
LENTTFSEFMSEPQDVDIGRSFRRLNKSEKHRAKTLGYGHTRQGLALAAKYVEPLIRVMPLPIPKMLAGTPIDDLAWRLLTIGISLAAQEQSTIYDTLAFLGHQLAPRCKDRIAIAKIGEWAANALRQLKIFECAGETLMLSATLNDFMDEIFVQRICDNALLYPLREPPTPWTQVSKGGLPPNHWACVSLISGHYHCKAEDAVRGAIGRGRMDRVLDALNYLQSIPFVINEPVLKFMQRIRPQVPPKPANGEAVWKRSAQEQWKERQAISGWYRDLAVARLFAGAPFWIPLHLDFRGRINPIPHFNFAREDHVRALFLFAHGEPIGIEGLRQLKAHVAARADGNTWSRDSKPSRLNLAGRIAWTQENLDTVLNIGSAVLRDDDPTTIEHWLPSKDDDRYQFIAACVELVRAGDDANFITQLPLVFDASCSGLQHLSGMRRDETVGRWVNLTAPDDPDEPRDFYGIMAVALWNRLRKRPHLRNLMAGPLDRKIVKQPVMSYFYGSTRIGMADQIVEEIARRNKKLRSEERTPIMRGDIFLPYRLAESLYELLEQDVAPRAAETLNHLRRLAELCAANDQSLRFDTKLGMTIRNDYFEPRTKRIAIRWNGRRRDLSWIVGETNEIDCKRAANSIAANFVHAADACHLQMVALAAADEGLPMVTIHDCFGTNATHAARLNKILRQSFERLHRHNLLNEVWQAARRNLPKKVELPPQLSIGELDLAEIAENFFAFN